MSQPLPPVAHTRESQQATSPKEALRQLAEGNDRFVTGAPRERNWGAQIEATAAGQFPIAVVLGCIDSRVPVEHVFDQAVGDVFTARVAGHVINEDILGSMEFACGVVGAKAVVVLGHTGCGAVQGAIDGVQLGHLTGLIEKIRPAIDRVTDVQADEPGYADAVTEANVQLALDDIRSRSELLAGLEGDGKIDIAGAVYDVSTGAVRWL